MGGGYRVQLEGNLCLITAGSIRIGEDKENLFVHECGIVEITDIHDNKVVF